MNRTRILRIVFTLLCLLMKTLTHAEKQPEAYKLYDNKGNVITYDQLIKSLSKVDVVFIGEIHNCTITHWLELKLLESLYKADKKKLKIGLEMFERDNQLILNEYLQGQITGDRFEDEVRLWSNYSTDYAPLISFARENHVPVIATNVPRRYATAVKEHSLAYLDSLSAEAKSYMAPLPIEYQENENAEQGFAMMGMLGRTNIRMHARLRRHKPSRMPQWLGALPTTCKRNSCTSMAISTLTDVMVSSLTSLNINQAYPMPW